MDEIKKLYNEYYTQVFNFIYRMSRDYYLSEDIAQETFLKATLHIGKFDGKCKISSWLCQIAKNLYLDHLRKNKKYNYTELNEQIESASGVEKDKEWALSICEKIHSLEEPYKEVFMMHHFGDIPLNSLAKMFGKSESWARVTYYRAKEKIRNMLEEEDRHEESM